MRPPCREARCAHTPVTADGLLVDSRSAHAATIGEDALPLSDVDQEVLARHHVPDLQHRLDQVDIIQLPCHSQATLHGHHRFLHRGSALTAHLERKPLDSNLVRPESVARILGQCDQPDNSCGPIDHVASVVGRPAPSSVRHEAPGRRLVLNEQDRLCRWCGCHAPPWLTSGRWNGLACWEHTQQRGKFQAGSGTSPAGRGEVPLWQVLSLGSSSAGPGTLAAGGGQKEG